MRRQPSDARVHFSEMETVRADVALESSHAQSR